METDKQCPAITATDVSPARFAGKWYVVATNYEFWRNDNRTHPVISLELLDEKEDETFLSRVEYKWRGFSRTITGFETQDSAKPGRFVWQGKGLLFFIKNEWFLIAVADDYSWAFTYFPKSNIGTLAGIDILSRSPEIKDDLMNNIISKVNEDEFMRTQTKDIFRTVQG